MKNFEYYLLAFKKYAEFDGRANRREFWYFMLFHLVVCLLIDIIDGPNQNSSMLMQIYQLATVVPTIALAIRRIHDIGKSGWFVLIPLYNLYLYCQPSQKGSNKYGAQVN